MSNDGQIELDSLCGLHVIDGRASFIAGKQHATDENATVFVLRLDGVLYWFQEDPDDGYRSSLGVARVCTLEELAPGAFVEFEPIMVAVRMQTDPEPGSYSTRDDRLYGINEATGLVLFEVGTENLDDYYPSFVARWDPEGYRPHWLPNVAGADKPTDIA